MDTGLSFDNTVGRAAGSARDSGGLAAQLLDLVSDRVVFLDPRGGIVRANRAFWNGCGASGCGEGLGRTLGEVMNCRHLAAGGACGEKSVCAECGWFQTLGKCREQGQGEGECRFLAADGTAFDFQVRALPLRKPYDDGAWCVCVLQDMAAPKRLRVVERAFFHDVTNLAVGIRGMSEILETAGTDEGENIRKLLLDSANRLTSEIERLRTLRVAENGDVRVWYSSQPVEQLLQALVKRYEEDASSRHLTVSIDMSQVPFAFDTDRELFMLVHGELLLNAIEASVRNDRILLGFARENGRAVFSVRNPYVMDPPVQAHVFERSFTTKGSGRGVGTYRAKMVAERYLQGAVWFTSQAPEGTVFYVSYPLVAAGPQP